MAFKIITVPFSENKECFLEDELNQFLLSKNVKSWQAEFFSVNGKAYWTVFLEYETVLAFRTTCLLWISLLFLS